jgi:4-hydroxybenzoate polyprenyltransferase
MNLKQSFKLLRPQQWIKNFFVFAALMFSGSLFVIDKVIPVLLAFGIFCLASSTIYILNDIMDVENDKKHPKKKFRPIASGDVSIKQAYTMLTIFLISALLLSFKLNIQLFLIIAAYLIINVLYSKWLKNIVIIDLVLVSIGYVLRVLAGTIGINAKLSPWIMAATFTLSMMIILAKRRSELVLHGPQKRKVLKEYDINFMNLLLVMCATITLTIYLIWTFENVHNLNEFGLIGSSLFVFYGISRYLYLTIKENSTESPTKLVLKDKALIACVGLWTLYIGFLIYFF